MPFLTPLVNISINELPENTHDLVRTYAQAMENIAHDGRSIGPGQLHDLEACSRYWCELILGRHGLQYKLGYELRGGNVYRTNISFTSEEELARAHALVPEFFAMEAPDGVCVCDVIPGVTHP